MTDQRPSFVRTAWLVVVLLWPVALLNYLDRQMMATMKTSMMADIPTIASDTNWGFLLGSFKWVYAALSPFGGYFADRVSRRWIIIVSLFVWSAVTWGTGHAATLNQLLTMRALMGISEAFYIPAALALIADFHQGETRSRAIGIHQMAIYVGIIVGGFGGRVADAPMLGWRWAFSAAGIAGMLYALPLIALLPGQPRRESAGSPAHRRSLADALGELAGNHGFRLLVLCFTLPAIAGWIVKDWMPAILKEQLHLSQGQAGIVATLSPNLASFAGAILGGWLADRWMRTNLRGRTFVSTLGLSLLIPALFGITLTNSVPAAVVVLAIFGIGWGFFDCNNMPILCQIVRPELRATGYGIMNFVSISIGGFADLGFGFLKDRGVPNWLTFGVCAAAALYSVVTMLRIRPRPELIAAEAGPAEDQDDDESTPTRDA
jgi:MFS family permease